jgi:hypothetical protein
LSMMRLLHHEKDEGRSHERLLSTLLESRLHRGGSSHFRLQDGSGLCMRFNQPARFGVCPHLSVTYQGPTDTADATRRHSI